MANSSFSILECLFLSLENDPSFWSEERPRAAAIPPVTNLENLLVITLPNWIEFSLKNSAELQLGSCK